MPVVFCRRNPGGWRASLSLWSHLGSLLPLVHSLMVTGGHGARASVHPSKCQGGKGLVVTLACLCAVAAPAAPGLSRTFTPAPSTSQPRQGQGSLTQHLAGCSPLGLSAALSPTTPTAGGKPPLSFISCPQPPHSSHPAVGCDKGLGLHKHQHCGTQRRFAACARLPALTPPTPLRFRAQRAGSGAEPHLLLLPFPVPTVSPSLPAPQDPSKVTPQQCSIGWKQKSYNVAQPCMLGMHRKMPLHLEVLRVSSLCHHAEGHRYQEPLYPTVSRKHFQEEMISNNLA